MPFAPFPRVRFRTSRGWLAPGALMLVAVLTACRTVPTPDGFAQASASVAVEDAPNPVTSIGEEAVHFNRFQAQTFEGYGAAKPPADASGSFQARAYARAEARRKALRILAGEIVAFEHEGKPTLKAILGDAGDWRATLEQSLEQRATVDFRTKDGLELARARIRGDAIFHGPAAPGSAGQAEEGTAGNELELIARRRTAEEAAIRAARDFLYEDLLGYGATTNVFGLRTGPSAAYKKALREELDALPPQSVEFTDDGQCIVLMAYDRSGLSRLKR